MAKKNQISKLFFISSLVVILIGLFSFALLGLFWMEIILSILIMALFVTLLYKAWSSIQDKHTQITPGKAIGFLFIPFYNFYWIFRSIGGFPKEYNSFIKRHKYLGGKKISGKLFITYCWLIIVNVFLIRNLIKLEIDFLVVFGMIFIFVTYIVLLMLFIKICDAINNLKYKRR